MHFISGLSNCHIPGLYSLVLSQRQNHRMGMKRVFYCSRSCKMPLWDGADFRIKPHNHRQHLTLTPLFGNVTNVEMRIGAFRQDLFHVWKYRFRSALLSDEGFGLERMEEMQASLEECPLFAPIDLHWSQIHTVVAEPESAWLVEEGKEAPPFIERCFSISHRLELSREGLYLPLTEEQLKRCSNYFTVKVGA